MAKQGKKRPLEPGDTIFSSDTGSDLFDHHIRRQVIGAGIHTLRTEKTALENILGSLVQLQMPLLVGTQQLYKSSGRGSLIRIDLMNGTDRNAFTALDTCVTGLGKVKDIF